MKNLRKFIKYSFSVVVIIFPISILMVLLKSKELIFFNPFDLQILAIDFLLISLIILFTRSFLVAAFLFYSWVLAPFISWYFLRRGILYSDFLNFGELFYFLGTPLTVALSFILIIVFFLSIYNNLKNFSKILLSLQTTCLILIFSFFNLPNSTLNAIYKDHQTNAFNISANFRFMGVNNAFLYSILDTRSFERDLIKQGLVNKYRDFRAFNGELTNKKNIHIIILESYLDLQGFDNLEFDTTALHDEWRAWNEKYAISALSPVTGGGSAQAEFEILCGAKSILEYGTEFNRLGGMAIPCLPNFLKNFGYSTFASQPIYSSFFNAKKAYESIGFDKIWLAENLDMSKLRNGWLPDELFFDQHLKLITPYLTMDQPIVNYLFAVGCHSQNNMGKNDSKINIAFNTSEIVENYLNCYLSTSHSVREYIRKINEIDSNNIFLILPDHLPPFKSSKLKKMGINQFSDPSINLENDSSNNNTDLSIANGHINYGYLIHDGRILHERNIAYYEIPEILIDIVSNGELCIELSCSSQDSNIMFQEDYLHRDSFKNSAQSNNNQMKANYQRELNISLIKQSNPLK
jgi:hypothetical protein|tara:strand:- start:13349 stop:15079 length:1731 start_codon:yes stop_codon:yes gene_type:complete